MHLKVINSDLVVVLFISISINVLKKIISFK